MLLIFAPFCSNEERLLLYSPLPSQHIAWYVKSPSPEEELVGDTRTATTVASSTQITNVHIDMHDWDSCSSNSFLIREMATSERK